MNDSYPSHPAQPTITPDTSGVRDTPSLPLKNWLMEGLRAGSFLPPRTAGRSPTPLQVALIFTLCAGLELALPWLQMQGSPRFSAQAWLSGWWSLLVFVGMAWWAFSGADAHSTTSNKRSRVAACFALSLVAALPSLMLYELLMAALAYRWVKPAAASVAWVYGSAYFLFMVWSFGALALLGRRFTGWSRRTAVFVLVMMACTAVSVWQFDQRPWQADYSSQEKQDADKPRLRLSQ